MYGGVCWPQLQLFVSVKSWCLYAVYVRLSIVKIGTRMSCSFSVCVFVLRIVPLVASYS